MAIWHIHNAYGYGPRLETAHVSCFNVTALMIMNIISNLHNIGSVWTTVVCGLVVLTKRTKLDDTQKKLSDTIAQKNVPSQTCLKQLSNRSKIIVNVALCFGGNSGKTETQGTLPRINFTYTCSLICSRKLLKLYTVYYLITAPKILI